MRASRLRGVAVEDVDDDAGAIEHQGAGRLLEVAQLARGQLVVDDHHRGLLPDAAGWRLAGAVRVGGSSSSASPSSAASASQRSLAFEVRSAAPEAMTPGPPVSSASSLSLPAPSTVPRRSSRAAG